MLPSLWRLKITLEFNVYPKECGTKDEMIVLLWISLQELDFLNCHYSLQENWLEIIFYDTFIKISMSYLITTYSAGFVHLKENMSQE